VAQRVNNEEEQRRLSHEALWRRFDAMELRLTAAVSERMLELANLAPGMRVLDLATGRGEPAIRAAHCVGETGHVLGIDLSEAKQRSWEAELLAETRPARPGEPRRLGGVTRIIRARPGA